MLLKESQAVLEMTDRKQNKNEDRLSSTNPFFSLPLPFPLSEKYLNTDFLKFKFVLGIKTPRTFL